MPVRTFTYRGFGLSLRVPERLPEAINGLRGRAAGAGPNGSGPGSSCARPRVTAGRRSPAEAAAFLADFYGGRSAAEVPDDAELARMPLEQQVASTHWYHTIELPGGVVTPGTFDHRPLVPHYGIPGSLAGKRCLDVGCSNGFWTFEFERRGGSVVAVEIPSLRDADFPAGTPPMPADGPDELSAAAFHIAHRALGSRAELVRSTVYDMDPQELGTFDFVHLADVLLHLRDPLTALCRLRELTADGGTALIAEVFDPSLMEGTTRYLGGFDGLVWWEPSLDTLVQMVYDAGFGAVEVLRTYRTPARGHWRALMSARA